MSNDTTYSDDSNLNNFEFRTNEGVTAFKINVNGCLIDLTDENKKEIVEAGQRKPYDRIIFDEGVMLRYSLTDDQKQQVLTSIRKITKCDYDYCLENDIVRIGKHILNDYLTDEPSVLVERGWSDDELELLMQMTRMLCNTTVLDKATVKFKQTGESIETLAYTVIGEESGYQGKLAISFETNVTGNEAFLVVTVLERKKV